MAGLPDPGVFGAAFEQFMREMSMVAEQRESEVAVRLRDHLGPDPRALPTTGAEFGLTEHANLQLALDAVLGDAELVGFTSRHMGFMPMGLSELLTGLGMAGPVSFGLLHAMAGRTTILLTGRGLGLIEQALAIGRELSPATFVFEDIDLVAAERTMEFGSQGVLFELLNQMEGLAEDEDLLFVLTTNRPDLIEPALAARPGRIDLALEIPLPDADGRRRLLLLYGRGVDVDPATLDQLVERSDRVSGAFIKELVRLAWLRAALDDREPPTAQDLREVLDELLDERSTLTRRLLGRISHDPTSKGRTCSSC